jgi:alpha-methylacyl-CoA racemase
MEKNKLLDGISILDFSHRLPGPLAGKILADLGATVIKIEDEVFKDAFLSGMFASFDKSFTNWYEELNANKQIVRLNFKSETIKEDIRPYLDKADAIIMGPPPKLRAKLGVDQESLNKLGKPFAAVELLASKEHNNAMHDLNAMAMTGMLSLFINEKFDDIVDPPFLPFMGIAFGQQVASSLTAAILRSVRENKLICTDTYLYDDSESVFAPFWPKQDRDNKRTKFLHNGAFPCYSLYKLADGNYAAIAAVEEKFWKSFIRIFNIDVPATERFNTSAEIFNKVSTVLKTYNSDEFGKLANEHDICLSLVSKI